MKSLLNPKWLYVVNTAPILLLYFILGQTYSVINTLLPPETKEFWVLFAIALGSLTALNFGYATYLMARKKSVNVMYGYFALFLYIIYLYFYFNYADDLLPANIPFYMVPGNIPLYNCTFLMPTLAYSLFIIVVAQTPTNKQSSAALSFAYAVLVVLASFILFGLAISLEKYFTYYIFNFVIVSFCSAGVVVFLYYLTKAVYILTVNKSLASTEYRLWWRVPIGILLPLIGLFINNGGVQQYEFASGMFGNFSSPWFYILALINGILLCLPVLNNKKYRLILFFARSITFSYTLYFFLVFLPFLPLSIIAIIIIGVGFLMLAPLLLFIMHVHDLATDYDFIRTWLSGKIVTPIFIIGILAIPVYITITYKHEKHVLKQALTYVYEPDYSKEYAIDTVALRNTINILRAHKNRPGFGFQSEQVPYLSSYYNYVVLDNLTLSDVKINDIEKIFFGKTHPSIQFWRGNLSIAKDDVVITKLKPVSNYNSDKKQWESTINFEITNNSPDSLSEFETNFALPAGCWINNYYLYINGKKEKGILAEKKICHMAV
jgi:hypothetical protein